MSPHQQICEIFELAELDQTISGANDRDQLRSRVLLNVQLGPMTIQTAAAHVRTWLQQPVAMLIEMHPEDADCALGLLSRAGAGGNLTTDAQLAALAIRHRAVVHTADSDFARFPEVRWKNPLIGG